MTEKLLDVSLLRSVGMRASFVPLPAVGGKVRVPAIGSTLELKRPPRGASSGKILRLRGKGVVDVRNATKAGDLLVEVVVTGPRRSDE